MKKKEQIESELRTIIKNSKKGIFVNLTLTNLIEISRRMYVIYDNFKSGEKFEINNNDENISILNNVLKDFKKLNKKKNFKTAEYIKLEKWFFQKRYWLENYWLT